MYIKYFDRIDVSEGIDFNKTCASKGWNVWIYIYIYICVYNSSMFKE